MDDRFSTIETEIMPESTKERKCQSLRQESQYRIKTKFFETINLPRKKKSRQTKILMSASVTYVALYMRREAIQAHLDIINDDSSVYIDTKEGGLPAYPISVAEPRVIFWPLK